MVLEGNVISQNYGEICDLSDAVSRTILERRVPQPDDIAIILGGDAVKPYYLMHALLHLREYGRRRGVLDHARRDGKAIQIHSYDSSVKPYYRLKDENFPSNYLLTSREIKGILVHDLGEEFGRTPLGALIVNEVISNLLGGETGRDAGILTNYNALLLDSLGGAIKRLPNVGHDSVYGALKKGCDRINVTGEDVQRQYGKILNALRAFESYIRQNAHYMPKPQKGDLLRIINEMLKAASDKTVAGHLFEPHAATKAIIEQYQHVIKIMEGKQYIDVDSNLVLPGDPKFLLTLKKTLYSDYLSRIAGAVIANPGSQNGHGDSYLAPMMEKLAESTNTVANMVPAPLTNSTSIFRKARALITAGTGLAEHLKESGIEYQRLQNGIDYLVRNLETVVGIHLRSLQELCKVDDNWGTDLRFFTVMKDKMGGRIK